MDISVTLPLDNDGFLRRECPHCFRQFKWHSGPANEEAENHSMGPVYYCPLCGASAVANEWYTNEQAEYLESATRAAALEMLNRDLSSALDGIRSKHIKVTRIKGPERQDRPDPLTEPDDMIIVSSPCHAWEPVKIPEGTQIPAHCLVCGAAFTF